MLQKIREKELAVSTSVDLAAREAEGIVQNARKDAENILKMAEEEGEREAKTIYENEMMQVSGEIEHLRSGGMAEAMNVREIGEQRISAAVSYVVKNVLLE